MILMLLIFGLARDVIDSYTQGDKKTKSVIS